MTLAPISKPFVSITRRTLVGWTPALCIAACQSSPMAGRGTVTESGTVVAGASPTAPPPAAPAGAGLPFADWLENLRGDARRRGIGGNTIARALTDVAPIPRVVELDRRQPEFTQTFWRYLDGAVTERRIAAGRAKLREHAALLSRIEESYGVPRRFLVAFWGLETNYGANLGDFPVIGALATLAYDGRRSAFFRAELLDALTIVDRGHSAPEGMIGSWAGAMGQTQFMPSTFIKHAVDVDGDQRIDLWRSVADALGSGAHYLKNLGWDRTRTWGREVRLPDGFDVGLASIDTTASETVRPLSAWAALGVRRSDGAVLPGADIPAALVLPAGARGPAFLVYENYRTILKWNRSTFYAIAIGHLADRLVGGGAFAASKSAAAPMARADVTRLQQALADRRLIEPAGVDGVLGAATRRAVRTFQRQAGLPPDGFVDTSSLTQILSALAASK